MKSSELENHGLSEERESLKICWSTKALSNGQCPISSFEKSLEILSLIRNV